MSSTNGTISRPKFELLELNQPVKLKLLKDKPHIGTNSYGEYYLYTVQNDEGVEFSYFASAEIHNLIQQHKLKNGSSFILKKTAAMNGKKITPSIEFSIIGEPESQHNAPPLIPGSDGLKEILLQCVKDAADVIRASGIQLGNDELQKLATTLFIQRAKNA